MSEEDELSATDRIALEVAKAGNPGLSMALLAAARGDSLLTLHCPFDGSKVYVKAERILHIEDHPRGAQIYFTEGGDNRPLLVRESRKWVRDLMLNALAPADVSKTTTNG